MTFQLFIDPDAAADLLETFYWYEEQRHGLGATFRQRADDVLSAIAENPLARARIYRSVRSSRIHGFPYRVIYLVDRDIVKVLAIVHDRRHPRVWRRRLR